MFQQFVCIAAGQSYFDQAKKSFENKNQFENKNSYPLQTANYRNKYIHQLSLQAKFKDANLTKEGLKQCHYLKNKVLDMQKIDIVITAPLKKSLQSCQAIFQNKKHIKVIIQPLLADQVNSSHSLPNMFSIQQQIFNKFQNSEVLTKGVWITQVLSQLSSLQRKKDLFDLLKQKKGQLQSKEAFIKRLNKLKDKMIHYMQKTKKKLVIVASSQLLASLFATNFLQNGTPVNPLKLNHGQVQACHMVMNNVIASQQSVIPFCS